jgi:hypothetical protein
MSGTGSKATEGRMIPSGKLDSAPLLAFTFRSTVEWRSPRHNVLLEGSEPSTLAVLRLLEPHLPEPVIRKRRGRRSSCPDGDIGALILEEVSDLSGDEQARLLEWIDCRAHTQIVSTTERPLFACVTRGLLRRLALLPPAMSSSSNSSAGRTSASTRASYGRRIRRRGRCRLLS